MCKINLIIKVMDGNYIGIITENNILPNIELSNLNPDLYFSLKFLANEYQIHEAYLNPKLVYFGTDNNIPEVYYTICVPREFLNEKAIGKISNEVSKLNMQDCLAIRQSLSVLPY